MGTKGRSVPRIVCCAIPISRAAGKVLVVTSRKRPDSWVCECFSSVFIPTFESPTLPRHSFFFFFPLESRVSQTLTSFTSLLSTQRWLGAIGCAVGGCSLERGPGRRSYPLLSSSPHLLILVLSVLPPSICCVSCNPTAGVRGTITRYVTTIPTPSTTYHFYELDVAVLEPDWLERKERRREWVDYHEAIRRLEWKAELAQGLRSSSLAR